MNPNSMSAALAAEQETSVESIRNNLVGARDSIRAATEAIERLNAMLGKRG